MTGKDRVLTVLRGGIPDRVPFAPNIGQWFSHRAYTGTLPAELQGCRDELDVMIRLKCDIFSRRLGPFYKTNESGYEVQSHYEPLGDGGSPAQERRQESPVRSGAPIKGGDVHPPDVCGVTEYVTPVGTLRNKVRFVPESHTTFQYEYYVKDFQRDYPALRYIVENSESVFDDEAYRKVEARVGDHGVAFVPMAQSPIKLLHNWAGAQQATLFIVDYERECEELFEIHTEKVLEMARQAAQSPALCFILMDNLDSMFFPPPLFRKLNLRFYQQVADVLHGAGKLLFSHACGQLWALRDLIAEANLDGMESISHAPLGDLPLTDAKKIHSKFIVNGGMTVHEMEVTEDPGENIRRYVRTLFLEMRPFDRFIFANSCNTSIETPWENLLAFREACWEFGTSDH